MEASSLLPVFGEIHSMFDARKEDKLPVDNAPGRYNTRSSSSSHPRAAGLNLGGNWNDGLGTVDSSVSPTYFNDNLGGMTPTVPNPASGNLRYHDIVSKHANTWVLAPERAFLTRTTLTTIVEELEDVRMDLRILVSQEGTKIKDFRIPGKALSHFVTSLLQDPLSGSSISTIRSGWEALDALDVGEHQISLLLRAQRSCIMLTNYLAWYWLDVCIRDACNSIMDKQPDCPRAIKCPWLVRLVEDVQEVYHLRYTRHQFCSSSYGITIPQDTSHSGTTFQFLNECRNVRDGNALRGQVLNTVEHILRSWLCYPSPDEFRIQAWLVHVLINQFGRPVLYLNSVWKTYTVARKRSIDTQPWYISSFRDVKPLQQAAANHPLSNKDSPESNALQKLGMLIDSFMADDLDTILSLRREEGSTTQAVQVDQLEIPYQLDCLKERRVKIFAQFVMDCLSIFLGQGESTVTKPKLKKTMDKIPDKLMPFREHAPSRRRIRGNNGPFTAAYARTTAGAYSAAVWRGITFATPFSMNNRMVFTSYGDFNLACSEAGDQEEAYFCDKGAYGQANPMRKIELAEDYWKTLADGKWTEFVRDDRIVPFTQCYNFFVAGHRPPDFPQLGPLASYLLTADFSYCCPKVVESPTLPEMALLICSFNKGAIDGLENLGFITPRPAGKGKANLKESEMALGRVYDLLKKIIPAEHQETINLDLIMTEHTLCKFSWAMGRKLIEQL
jgi:hypothetical protein